MTTAAQRAALDARLAELETAVVYAKRARQDDARRERIATAALGAELISRCILAHMMAAKPELADTFKREGLHNKKAAAQGAVEMADLLMAELDKAPQNDAKPDGEVSGEGNEG